MKEKVRISSADAGTRKRITRLIETGDSVEPVLIVAGEHSGDLLGGDVIRALGRLGIKQFFGTGGESMKSGGCELIMDVDAMAVMGFVDALRNYRRLKKLALTLVEEAKTRGAKTAVLIDYPGFNLKLAGWLKDAGIRVVFLVSPQLWAWHYSRIEKIKKSVDLMLVLFEFEKRIYEAAGVQCECIGHPMIRRIPEQLAKEPPVALKRGKTITLMPGSRRSEIKGLLPAILGAARILKEQFPGLRFLLPNINKDLEGWIQEQIQEFPELKVEYMRDRSLRCLEACDLVLVASGTATLETAFFLRPMVIVYRTGWVNLILASMLMRTRYVGIVNILARKPVALELLQTEVTPENIALEAARILEDDPYRRGIIAELEFIKKSLGTGNPAEKAARAIAAFVRMPATAR